MLTTPRNDEDMAVVTAMTTYDRRSILRKLAAGGVAVAGCSALPGQWFPLVLEFATLPAHAATSGGANLPESAKLYGYKNSLTVDDRGEIMQCDSINQHKISFSKLGPEYGSSMLLIWSDGNELHVPNSAKMGDER